MRVTNNMMINNMMRNLNRNLYRLDKRQMQVATGKKIHRPSDDPIGTTRSLQIRSDVRILEQHKSSTKDAVSWMTTTEDAVASYVDALQRSRELTVQASSGTLTEEDTIKINKEIEELREHIISLGNTSYGGKYVFSGKQTDQPLLNPDGSYNVNQRVLENDDLIDDKIHYTVGHNQNMPVNLVGIEVFDSPVNTTDWSETMDFPAPGETSEMEFNGVKIVVEHTGTIDDEEYKLSFEGADGLVFNVNPDEHDSLESKEAVIEALGEEWNKLISDEGNREAINEHNFKTTIKEVDPDINDDTLDTMFENFQESSRDSYRYGNRTIYKVENFNFTAREANYSKIDSNLVNESTSSKHIEISSTPKKPGVIQLLDRVSHHLENGDQEALSEELKEFDIYLNQALTARADIGSRMNRGEMMLNRIEGDIVNFRERQSDIEDVDMAEALTELMNEENVYNASLSVGARIIQPTLIDFLR